MRESEHPSLDPDKAKPGNKLFAKVISGQQKLPLTW